MTSRRELYAHGEPFGDSCTRRKIDGKGYVCGFGGDSSSSNTDYNTNYAYDNRQALGDNAIGATGGSTLTITTNNTATDPGALRAMETAILSNTATSRQAIESANATATAAAAAAQRASQDAISSATTTQRQALNFATEGFSGLLSAGLEMFNIGADTIRQATTDSFNLVDATQSGLANAYQTATAEKSGSLDNKTIMVLGIAALALGFFAFRKR